MVKLQNVSFCYSDQDIILEKANLDITPNKISVILGKNGVGKTTLLSIIDGFITYDDGLVEKQEDSAFIYDNPHLYEYLTGQEYIDLITSINNKDIHRNDLVSMLGKLELTTQMDKVIASYSLGMKHKLALLTAIIMNYNLYLIDEPLAALDPESQMFMMNFFKEMKEENKTLVISTHMLHVAYELADEIIIFKDHQLQKIENNYKSFDEFKEFVLKSLKVEV